MSKNNPYAAYQQNTVNTSSPAELTLMLYDGSLKFISRAKRAMEEENIAEKNEAIQRAQAIVTELMVTLDQSVPVAKNMLTLYEYVNYNLIEANVHNDIEKLDEAANIMREFRDTWKQVIQINRQKQFADVDEI